MMGLFELFAIDLTVEAVNEQIHIVVGGGVIALANGIAPSTVTPLA